MIKKKMSQDIRSYFLNSKQNLEKNSKANKISKTTNLEFCGQDEKDTGPIKETKPIKYIKQKHNNKSSTKKRTISSDEDEVEIVNILRNKKIRTGDVKGSSNVQTDFLNKKPIKRINAVKIKNSKKIIKKSMNHKANFLSEDFDDDFDATLNQLDTSQIEDEYLSNVNNKTSLTLNFNDNIYSTDKIDNNQQTKIVQIEKDSIISDYDKLNKSYIIEKNKETSTESSKIKEIYDTNTKDNSLNKDNKKNVRNVSLKYKKQSQSCTMHYKTINMDYNEIIKKKIEQKKHNAILYQNYRNRQGPRNPGSKEIPKGADQCLANLNFLITGVLDSLEIKEVEAIIKQYSGKILRTVSKKLNYIIVGDEAGPVKLAKAESLGIKKITEDDLLDLIRTRSPGIGTNKDSLNCIDEDKHKQDSFISYINKENNIEKDDKSILTNSIKDVKKLKTSIANCFESTDSFKSSEILVKSKNSSAKTVLNKTNLLKKHFEIEFKEKLNKSSSDDNSDYANIKAINKNVFNLPINNQESKSKIEYCINDTTALVEKYRPKELKQIIGQNGEKSNAKKLLYWLGNWYKNHGKQLKNSKVKYLSRDDTGTIYKAALLSGSPGIGKTTTAYVVCAQLGYEILEFNASDSRSKKLLQDEISAILSNKTIKTFFKNVLNTEKLYSKHVLLMDEVDGMAGNEDRGGMQELIAFIKATEVPIICICNDRNNQKMKTLANYTFDLRFQKPRLEQIRAAMMSLCFKEGIKITPEELTLIIQSTNQDIRQVINHISILSTKTQISKENKEEIKYKNLKLGPWDVVRKVFSSEEHKIMSIPDKSDLFFHDYNIAALFVQENYPIVTPNDSKKELYQKLANCSESLAIGDTIENYIRVQQAWNLLPVQACFSSVLPGSIMSGFIKTQINFPSWLAKNSKRVKYDRQLQDITIHSRITTGTNKEAINLDYSKMLVNSIIRPLIKAGIEGVDQAVKIMNNYHLTKEDLDSLIEITKWPHTRDSMQSIESKTKAAFTKAYNKSIHFSSANKIKKKNIQDIENENFIKNDEDEISDDNDDKIENDWLIKAKTVKIKNTSSKTKRKIKNNKS